LQAIKNTLRFGAEDVQSNYYFKGQPKPALPETTKAQAIIISTGRTSATAQNNNGCTPHTQE